MLYAVFSTKAQQEGEWEEKNDVKTAQAAGW